MPSVSVELSETLVKLVEDLIKEYPELGFKDVRDFVEDAVRNRIIDIRKYLGIEKSLKKKEETQKEEAPRSTIDLVISIIEELEGLTPWGAPEEEIIEKAEQANINREEVLRVLERLKQKGEVYSLHYGYYKSAKMA